jgi:hypothetical protein
MINNGESKHIIVTTGLKALAHKKMFADYDEYLKIQLELQKEEKEERQLNEALMPSIFDYIITLSIITISSYGIYYLRR